MYREVSAATGENVKSTFTKIASDIKAKKDGKSNVRNPNAYNSAYESEAPGEIYFDIFKLIGFFLILIVGYQKYSGNEKAFHDYMTFKTDTKSDEL